MAKKETKNTTEDPLSIRGKQFDVIVVSTKMSKTAVVESETRKFVRKYGRYEKKTRRMKVHNPESVNAKVGDKVTIAECRPLSKTKNFTIIENHGPQKGFLTRMEALEESKKRVAEKVKEDKSEEGKENASS